MAKTLIEEVREIRGRLQRITDGISLYQDHTDQDLPQWAEWEYYRLMDLLTTAALVAHRLEQILEGRKQSSE